MSSTSVKITGGEAVMARLKQVGIRTIRNVVMETEATAGEMENYSKANRPWTDRTGDARRNLYAVMRLKGDTITIEHGHGSSVHYGLYLEIAHGGKYRIIEPTVARYRAIWINNLRNVLGD